MKKNVQTTHEQLSNDLQMIPDNFNAKISEFESKIILSVGLLAGLVIASLGIMIFRFVSKRCSINYKIPRRNFHDNNQGANTLN